MSFTVTMPQLGETVTEGTILSWVKQPGDTIAEDDVLLEISTDKVDTEVPSPFAGTLLEILVPEGETVAVGTPLAVIGEPGESAAPAPIPAAEPAPEPTAPVTEAQVASAPAPAEAPAAVPPEPAAPPPAPGAVGVLSPVVRRLAAEHGIDLTLVAGTGRDGRITRRDLEAFIAAGPAEPRPARLGRGIDDLLAGSTPPPAGVVAPQAPAAPEPVAEPPAPVEPAPPPAPVEPPAPAPVAPPPEPSAPTPAPPPAPAPPPSAPPVPAAPPPPQPVSVPAASGETVEQIGRLRSRIAENMIRAKQTAAHVWTSMEVDFEFVERVRQRHRAAFKEREGFSLTYLPFIARATMDALAAYPRVNSAFDLEGGTRTLFGHVNLGIGVDLDQDGLVVMTVRGADGLRLRGIAREVRRLAEKARGGQMEPDDLAGSTFTITNPGPYGSFMSAPIINVPNVAILSTDGIKKRPVVVTDSDGNDALAIHHVGFLGLTWDHRAFDGSTAVLFLGRIKENIESWDWEQELA